MTTIRNWFILATVLAFVAGGGLGFVADRAMQPEDDAHPSRDANSYLEVFEREIGIESDAQRRALRAAYESYFDELQALYQRIAAEHQGPLAEIDRKFRNEVLQQLNPEQRRQWLERTGSSGGEVTPPDDPSEAEDNGE